MNASYKIPLPPVISRKHGRNHTEEHNERRLTERHFISNIPGAKGRKKEKNKTKNNSLLFCL